MIAHRALMVAFAACLLLGSAVSALPSGDRAAGIHLTIGRWLLPSSGSDHLSSRKYLLHINGRPGEFVLLQVRGLPRSWIASFCTPTICAPFHVSLQLPREGRLITELQIIPPGIQHRGKAQFTITAAAAGASARLVSASSPDDSH
jgi:hypothetical protein